MVEAALERFGRLDVLVNNAALIPWAPIDEIDLTEWRRITAVNLDGVFLACKAALTPMRAAGYGRIVNITFDRDPDRCPERRPLQRREGRRPGADPGAARRSWARTASPSTRSPQA